MTTEELYRWVKDHKDEILADMQTGNTHAQNIVTAYQMLTRFPEHGALAILEVSVKEYRKEKGI